MSPEVMTAWAAGLFEGEGCISLSLSSRPKGYVRPRLLLSTTDRDVLDKFLSAVGHGYIDGPHLRPNRKPFWTWRCATAAEVKEILAAFLPHLGARRAARAHSAFAALDALPGRPVGGRHWKAKLTIEDVRAIRAATERQTDIAARFNISQSQVSDIKLRRAWANAA